ncbi:hypothetical protein [Vibrio thalassae]|uniref:hypothetical protein n=1 Tax=Vibrio thalassae TaxID=1243014 RepID=UPI00360CA4FE
MEPSLADHAEVWQQKNHVLEERALVSRSVIAVFDGNSQLSAFFKVVVAFNFLSSFFLPFRI